ncbi:11799_t:CDS:2, partial [Ambispora gerdemannii]
QLVAAKSILARGFMCRLQVDLVDMHYRPDEAKEVAGFLFELFIAFGPLTILQTDNGKEFTVQIIRKLTEFWPTIRIINGCPRHPQSQGLIEWANDVLQQKLSK